MTFSEKYIFPKMSWYFYMIFFILFLDFLKEGTFCNETIFYYNLNISCLFIFFYINFYTVYISNIVFRRTHS